MSEHKWTVIIDWSGIPVAVSFSRFWLGNDMHHIEVRADQRLPITETGYRSHFYHGPDDMTLESAATFIVSWLDDAANNKSWLSYVEARRQGDLFDL